MLILNSYINFSLQSIAVGLNVVREICLRIPLVSSFSFYVMFSLHIVLVEITNFQCKKSSCFLFVVADQLMTEDLLQDLVQYKKSHEKAVSSAARSLISLFREVLYNCISYTQTKFSYYNVAD